MAHPLPSPTHLAVTLLDVDPDDHTAQVEIEAHDSRLRVWVDQRLVADDDPLMGKVARYCNDDREVIYVKWPHAVLVPTSGRGAPCVALISDLKFRP